MLQLVARQQPGICGKVVSPEGSHRSGVRSQNENDVNGRPSRKDLGRCVQMTHLRLDGDERPALWREVV